MGAGLLTLLGFEPIHQPLDILDPIPGRNHHRIRGLDNDVVLQSYCRQQAVFGMEIGVFHVMQNHISFDHVVHIRPFPRPARGPPRTPDRSSRLPWESWPRDRFFP